MSCDDGFMVVGHDLALDEVASDFLRALGHTLEDPQCTLSRVELATLLLGLQKRSVVYLSTEN